MIMKEMGNTVHVNWLQTLRQLREEVTPVIYGIAEAEAAGELKAKLEAFSEALEKLPPLLEQLRAISIPQGENTEELHEVLDLEQRALATFIDSCQLTVEQVKQPNRFLGSTIMLKVSLANRYWDLSTRVSSALLKK